MRVVVSAMGEGLEAAVSPVFGRCPVYVFVNTENMEFDAMPNPAMSAPGGAGIQGAQFAVSQGAQAVLTGNVGPNAFNVLQAAGVAVYSVSSGTVRQAVEALNSGQLQPVSTPTSGLHRGMGGGMGRGGGRGMGRGMGMAGAAWAPPVPPPSPGTKPPAEELSDLEAMAKSLKEQLDQVTKRIEDLEDER